MTGPYFQRNDKANWTFEGGALDYERDEIAKLIAEKTRADKYLDSPPERYTWMHWLVAAAVLVAAASITWCVAYGNGVGG